MGNTAHLLNKAAGTEMIASQDHPLVLSSGIHHGATVQWAAQLSSFSSTERTEQQQSIPGQGVQEVGGPLEPAQPLHVDSNSACASQY